MTGVHPNSPAEIIETVVDPNLVKKPSEVWRLRVGFDMPGRGEAIGLIAGALVLTSLAVAVVATPIYIIRNWNS